MLFSSVSLGEISYKTQNFSHFSPVLTHLREEKFGEKLLWQMWFVGLTCFRLTPLVLLAISHGLRAIPSFFRLRLHHSDRSVIASAATRSGLSNQTASSAFGSIAATAEGCKPHNLLDLLREQWVNFAAGMLPIALPALGIGACTRNG